jgi:hypothetical protein
MPHQFQLPEHIPINGAAAPAVGVAELTHKQLTARDEEMNGIATKSIQ